LTDEQFAVAVIGAGPAGLYGAKQLAAGGARVALLNRDLKLGGLAEYGIYHDKYKMKGGLRKQFRKLMDADAIRYYGNVVVGQEKDLNLDDLRAMGFQAVVVTVGAQGTKWLGLEGEDLAGVYHAKDLVYHYNQLPPYSEMDYPMGQRVVCIGVGNVMLDIANWCVRDLKIDEIIAVARRGPAEVKFTKKEMSIVFHNLDIDYLRAEAERTRPALEAVGQDVDAAVEFILSAEKGADERISDTNFQLHFLASPLRMIGEDGQVTGVEMEETTLQLRDDGRTSAVATGDTYIQPADTVVFCIGDTVDPSLGLPLDKWREFAKHPRPQYPQNGLSFEAYDPEKDTAIEGVFLSGWAREASSGLVGTARKDGEMGAAAVLAYLNDLRAGVDVSKTFRNLEDCLESLNKPILFTEDWKAIDAYEERRAEEQGIEYYKAASNEEMLKAIGKEVPAPAQD
jgi:ferredoxin--NADP+ reductase